MVFMIPFLKDLILLWFPCDWFKLAISTDDWLIRLTLCNELVFLNKTEVIWTISKDDLE